MTPWTDRDWQAYYLTHSDHQGLSLEDAAKKMRLSPQELKYILYSLHAREPDLFTDISSDGRRFDNGVSRYSRRLDSGVKKLF